MTLLLKLAALGGIVLLLISVYPGVLGDILFVVILLFLLSLPDLVIAGIIFLSFRAGAAAKKPVESDLDWIADEIGAGRPPVSRRRWIIVPTTIVVLSFVLIRNGIPRRVAFALSRPAFERHIATPPVSEFEGQPLGRWLGAYYVDEYAADPRGGVYFRTHAGLDGIGPDTMSYGFVYRPNSFDTPFGHSGYSLSHVVGDWYCFSVSND